MRSAFTLVELLVTIAVIGALLSILLTAAAPALEAGRASACQSNLRQLALSALTFANEHDQRLPSAQDASVEGVDRFWYGGGDFSEGAFHPEQGVMHAYLGSADVAGCPSLDDDSRSFQGPVDYAYNVVYLGLILRPAAERSPLGAELTKVRQPSRTVAFFDSGRIRHANPGWGDFERTAFGWPPSGRFGPDGASIPFYWPSFHGRHNNGAGHIAWLDGHVSARAPTRYDRYNALSPPMGKLEEHNLGDIDIDEKRDGNLSPPAGGADDVLFDLD